MKALAHPARLAALDVLGEGREVTATECAEAAGISPSAMSYHLRALERWGFVERVEHSEDGRERPWRAVADAFEITPQGGPAMTAATSAVLATTFDRVQNEMSRWAGREREQSDEWRGVAVVESSSVWLTAAEAKELRDLSVGYVESRQSRTAGDHPAGARRVRSLQLLVPLELDPPR
jgi:DNA-binding transcriptional ArsR family regulator